MKLIVTGSSTLLMEKGLKETLAGRFELIRAEHWNFQEAKSILEMSLDKYIEFGCYPGSIKFLDEIERWGSFIRDSIVEPVIGRDLLQLHPVEYPSLLRQLFGLTVSLPAQVVSSQKLHEKYQVKSTVPTIQNYLNLLSQCFLLTGIQKYSPSTFRIRKSQPKLIIHDNGLLRAFEMPITQNLSNERLGHYFENIIGARFIEAGWETLYWKERNLEVDFVVLGPNGEKWAIEVKTRRTKTDELRGLFEFVKRFNDFEPCLISLIGQEIRGIKNLDARFVLSLNRYG